MLDLIDQFLKSYYLPKNVPFTYIKALYLRLPSRLCCRCGLRQSEQRVRKSLNINDVKVFDSFSWLCVQVASWSTRFSMFLVCPAFLPNFFCAINGPRLGYLKVFLLERLSKVASQALSRRYSPIDFRQSLSCVCIFFLSWPSLWRKRWILRRSGPQFPQRKQ